MFQPEGRLDDHDLMMKIYYVVKITDVHIRIE